MFDPKAEKPVDPKEEETVRKFFLGSVTPEVKTMPSTSPERRGRSVEPLDESLGLGKGLRAKLEFHRRCAIAMPRDMTPRLAKRQQARP